MPEWSIGAVSKTVVPLRAPRVRIPVSPQKTAANRQVCGLFFAIKRQQMRTPGFVIAQALASARIPVSPLNDKSLQMEAFVVCNYA